jgi:hypothetical protein
MADPPPPPPPPLNDQSEVTDKGSQLPPTSRYPTLVSGQVSYTTQDAVKEMEKVPKNVYRIMVELKPRTADSTFRKAPWTLVARHLLSTIQLYDDTAIIIRKKENAAANKISSPEELPENPEEFERDYAYDVKLKSEKSVTFKIIIGTKLSYWKTFREGPLFKKMIDNDWYVKLVRLESQGTVATIGHLLYAHNRYVNQEDAISEIRNLIYPTHCDQIDLRVTKSKEYYYDGDKKVRVFTRWLTLDCPVDIASKLSTLLMEKWKLLKTDPKYTNYNLKETIFVPRNNDLVNFNARIENIGKQNDYLRTYRDVTVISNVKDMDATFRYSEEMGEIFEDKSKIGHRLQLRAFMRTWKDNSTGKPAIIAIHRTNVEMEYSLLSGKENMTSIHRMINLFIGELKNQLGFTGIRVGGTKGTKSTYNHSATIRNYANENFATKKQFQQKPATEKEKKEKDEGDRKNQWKTPPEINRRNKKGTKSALTINYSDQRFIQEYSDVVVGNSYNNNNNGTYTGNTNKVPDRGNKQGNTSTTTANNTITVHEGHHLGNIQKIPETNIINQKTIQQILESTQFQATLAKAVAPQVTKQVNSLVEPTIKKITKIEKKVGDLHECVSSNSRWQDSQTNSQTSLQESMNQMQSTMNTMMTLFKETTERDGGTKRNATTFKHIPLTPTRKQKTTNNVIPTTPTHQSKYNSTDTNELEASTLFHSSQNTFTEDSEDEAMTPRDASGEGEGQ